MKRFVTLCFIISFFHQATQPFFTEDFYRGLFFAQGLNADSAEFEKIKPCFEELKALSTDEERIKFLHSTLIPIMQQAREERVEKQFQQATKLDDIDLRIVNTPIKMILGTKRM